MGIKALRKKYGINLKRGDHVESYAWSKPDNQSLMLMFQGNITSVKDEKVYSEGYMWWLKCRLYFEINKTPNVVVRCKTTGTITYDSRETNPPKEEE